MTTNNLQLAENLEEVLHERLQNFGPEDTPGERSASISEMLEPAAEALAVAYRDVYDWLDGQPVPMSRLSRTLDMLAKGLRAVGADPAAVLDGEFRS